MVESQAEAQASSDPVNRFLELLPSIFLSGRAHLEGTESRVPEHWESLGWSCQPGAIRGECLPKGRCIGWEDAENGLLYLEPSACFAELQSLSSGEGDPLPGTKTTLWKRLRERGLIIPEEVNRLPKKVPGRGKGSRGIALMASAIGLEYLADVVGEVP